MSGPEKLGQQIAGGTETVLPYVQLVLLTSRRLTGDAREKAWSLISVFVNEHRRKAPTWGPPRIPECMSSPGPFPSACTAKEWI